MDLDFERDLLRWVRDPLLLMCVHTFVSPVFSDGDMYTIVRSDGSSRTLRGVTTVISDDLIEDGPPLSSEAKRAKRQIQVWTALLGNSCCLWPSVLAFDRYP